MNVVQVKVGIDIIITPAQIEKKNKSCDRKAVKKDLIEALVVSETIKNILIPERVKHIAKRCVEIQQTSNSENHELLLLKKQQAETNKSIINLMNAIEKGILTKNTKSRLIELEQAQEKIEYEIDRQKMRQPQITEKHIHFMLSQFDRESNNNDEMYNADIIECFVHSVYLYEDKLIVTYNLMDGASNLLSSALDLIFHSQNRENNCVFRGSDLNSFGPPNANKISTPSLS